MERPVAYTKEDAVRFLAVHRYLHHDCDASAMHTLSARCIPNQRRYHMVDSRNGRFATFKQCISHLLTQKQFVGIIAVNFPILKPFFTRAKKAVSYAKPSHASSGNALPSNLRLSHIDRKGKKRTVHDITGIATTIHESQEDIVDKAASEGGAESEHSFKRGEDDV